MSTRTAILKGYRLIIRFVDGSKSTEEFDTDEVGTLEDQVTNLFLLIGSVDFFRVEKVWSKPGETVTLKIKHDGE